MKMDGQTKLLILLVAGILGYFFSESVVTHTYLFKTIEFINKKQSAMQIVYYLYKNRLIIDLVIAMTFFNFAYTLISLFKKD